MYRNILGIENSLTRITASFDNNVFPQSTNFSNRRAFHKVTSSMKSTQEVSIKKHPGSFNLKSLPCLLICKSTSLSLSLNFLYWKCRDCDLQHKIYWVQVADNSWRCFRHRPLRYKFIPLLPYPNKSSYPEKYLWIKDRILNIKHCKNSVWRLLLQRT